MATPSTRPPLTGCRTACIPGQRSLRRHRHPHVVQRRLGQDGLQHLAQGKREGNMPSLAGAATARREVDGRVRSAHPQPRTLPLVYGGLRLAFRPCLKQKNVCTGSGPFPWRGVPCGKRAQANNAAPRVVYLGPLGERIRRLENGRVDFLAGQVQRRQQPVRFPTYCAPWSVPRRTTARTCPYVVCALASVRLGVRLGMCQCAACWHAHGAGRPAPVVHARHCV